MITLMQDAMVVNLWKPTDHSGSSVSKSNATYVSMKNYRRLHVIVTCGAMTEATTNFKAYQSKTSGKSVAASSISSTALAISEYWTNKSSTSIASSGAVFTRTAATSSKMVVTSTNSAVYAFAIDSDQLKQASSYDCVGVAISGISAAANFAVVGILTEPRYAKDAMPQAF